MGSKHDDRAPRKLAHPRSQSVGTASPSATRRAALVPRFSFKLGDRIGEDLTVIGHLAAGSRAELYQVWSLSLTCALTCKILAPGLGPHSKEARGLKREAHLLRRLAHPNVVRFFFQGIHEDRPFLVQEYLHGPSLLELIEASPGRRLPAVDAIKAAIHVAAALDHLHSRRFVHRDIKPANVLLRGGVPILVDFDAAFPLRAGLKPGRRMGTDPYMAPEQCLSQELTPAADVYGLGAVLYEMLTGRWIFEREFEQRTQTTLLEERFPQLRGKRPEAPSLFAPGLSRDLDRVVMTCLARAPANRYATARDVIRALAGLLEGEDQLWPDTVEMARRIA